MYFNEFLSQIPDFESVMKFAEKRDGLLNIELKHISTAPYKVVKEIVPNLIKEGKYEKAMFNLLKVKNKKITFVKIRKADNYDKAKFLFWIITQLREISELEQQQLSSRSDPEWINAGIGKLDVLGDFNTIDGLALSYPQYTHKDIEWLPYELVFSMLLRAKILRDVEKKRIENMRKK